MVEFTAEIGSVVQDVRRNFPRQEAFQYLGKITDLETSFFMISSVISEALLRPWAVQSLRSLWSVLFGSFIRVVVEFPGEIGCVLRDIHRIIYRHNLSSILDRSVISNFSKLMIRSVISENFSFYLKTEILKIRFEFARLPDLENSYYSWWKWCFQNIFHDLCRLIAIFCPRS